MRNLNGKGQTLVEYVMIIGLISTLAVSLVMFFGGFLKDKITASSCELVGEVFVEGEKRGEGYCAKPEDVKE